MSHFIKVGKTFDLFVFLFKEHLDEEHLSLLFDQVPTILPILRSFNWHIEAGVLSYIDLVSDVGIDGERGRLNIRLTEFAEAAFTRRSILFPNLQFFVLLLFSLFPGSLLILEREDAIVTRICKRVSMLLEA